MKATGIDIFLSKPVAFTILLCYYLNKQIIYLLKARSFNVKQSEGHAYTKDLDKTIQRRMCYVTSYYNQQRSRK